MQDEKAALRLLQIHVPLYCMAYKCVVSPHNPSASNPAVTTIMHGAEMQYFKKVTIPDLIKP